MMGRRWCSRGRWHLLITFLLLQCSASFVQNRFSWIGESQILRQYTYRPVITSLRQKSLDQSNSKSSLSPHRQDDKSTGPIGLYIHIPYCRQRCRYCDFAIVPIGNPVTTSTKDAAANRRTSGFEQMNEGYINALVQEVQHISKKTDEKITLHSIYFGGGTPSLAPVKSIASLLHHIYRKDDAPFRLADDVEITMEMDPGTFDRDQLFALKELGVNRISLGVQSLDNVILEGMGRFHRSHDIQRAVEDIAAVFGPTEANYSIDLISGAPGLTLAKWVNTLQQVTTGDIFAPVRPRHISIYDLQIEVGTVFEKMYGQREEDERMTRTTSQSPNAGDKSALRLPSEEECAFMYKYAAGYLRVKSFEHYEVSSYAHAPTNEKDRESRSTSWRSRHNQIYWDYESSWYALGLGATSFVDRKLEARPRPMSDYVKWVGDTKNRTSEIRKDSDNCDFLPDLLLKRLRTSDGLDLDWLERNYGADIAKGVLKGAQLGLELGLAQHTDANGLRLKDPDGFLYSNFIISSIFAELGLDDETS